MPKTNILAFIVIAAFLISGWWFLKTYVFEQPKAAAPVAQKDKDKAAPKKENETAQAKDVPKEAAKKEQPPAGKDEIGGVGPPPKAIAQEPVKDLQLGDPKLGDYYVLATITTRGAGVRNLTLPKFQQANENGRPVFNPDGSKKPLQFVEDDPIVASFLMYHYPKPDDTDKTGCVATLGQRVWKVERSSTNVNESEAVLSCEQIPGYPGLRIIKTYTLKPREYHVGLTIDIRDERDPKGPDKQIRDFRYQLSGSHGLPIEGVWYTSVYRSPVIGILDARGYLSRTLEETQYRVATRGGGERDPEGPLGTSRIQYGGVSTQFFSSLIVVDDVQVPPESGGAKVGDILEYCRPTLESEEMAGFIDRVDLADPDIVKLYLKTKEALPQTLVFVLLPRTKRQLEELGLTKGDHVFVNYYDPENGSQVRVATGIRTGHVARPQLDDITVRAVSKPLQLGPGKRMVHKFLLYHGPSKVRLLGDFGGDEAVDPALVDRYCETLHLNTLTDYSSWLVTKIPLMWMWSEILIKTTGWMHGLLYWLHKLVGNYGLTIMVLTLLVRGAMFPVSRRSALLSQRMQALAPEIKKLQEKYKTDPQAKTAAVMELYRKNKVNPFGSCLPMLLQMPFFLGLYYCLQESIHFRLASFLWMDNLAAPDMLIYWGNSIPIISDPDNMSGSFFSFLYLGPFFNLLPVIAVTLMLMQQKLMTPPPADEQQEMQQKMMKYMFVFIGVMFYKVAAGLCVYFIISSLWGLCERKMLPKKKPALAGTSVGGSSAVVSGGGKSIRSRGKLDKRDKKPDNTVQKFKDWWAELLKQAQKK
jgi:YidC/Oxa1 family membrane protein insertase